MISLINFDNVQFGGKLSAISPMIMSGTNGYTPSKYAEAKYQKGQPARIMNSLYDALRIYKNGTSRRYVGVDKYGSSYTEVEVGKETMLITLKKFKGTMEIYVCFIDSNEVTRKASNDDIAKNKAAMLVALMPEILKNTEAHEIYDAISNFLDWDEDAEDWVYNDHVEEFRKLLARLSTNVEARIIGVDSNVIADKAQINMDFSVAKQMTQKYLQLPDGIRTYMGTPLVFKMPVEEKKKEEKTPVNEFAGKYAYNESREFSEEEKNMKAVIPAGYVMPTYVPEICNFFKKSTNFPAPMRVAYLLGPAGTGKTEAANAIAAGLGLPIDHYTCNPNTEIFDFIGQVFPNTGSGNIGSFEDIQKELDLPGTDEIMFDPNSAYEKLYGKKAEGIVDTGALIVEMMNRVMRYAAENNDGGKNFTYVESGLIKAARNGYAYEIQEIGTVLRPGVAVGLNALLETGGNAFITLPTGEVIKKHKDATFIFTSNDEYEGTCNLNQSVLDRMALVYRIDNPPAEVMKSRIMSRLNFPDADILDRMIKVIYNVSEAAKERGITDGVCGYRSLENWCMAVMIMKPEDGEITDALVYNTAQTTVMNKTSQKREYVDELMSSLTVQFMSPDEEE